MNWYEHLFQAPVKALNDIRSNVWSVVLIIIGIMLVLHGHENVGGSLVTGAFAVFRSSRDEGDTLPPSNNGQPDPNAPPVPDPNAQH
jgi:hypothetical protein